MAGVVHGVTAAMPRVVQRGTGKAADIGKLVKEKWGALWK